MACRIAASAGGEIPSGLAAVTWKLTRKPVEVSFTHSKHTSAAGFGHRTPAAAASTGTSRRPADPAVRDCQYPWAPGRTVSSPSVTPQLSPKPWRSSSDRCSAKIASATGSGSRSSITNAFATAITPSDTGNSGRCE
jgi:hypothetical protein